MLHCASSGAPAWRPVSIVMTAHDLIPALQLNGQNQSERRDFFVTCVAERKSKQVIAVSERTRQDVPAYLPRARPREKR